MSVSRSTRRRIERLAPAVQRLYEADLRYFDRHPDHAFRLRQAGTAEVETQALLHPDRDMRRPEQRVHVIVRKLPGVRLRLYCMGREGMETDRSQAELAAMWAHCGPPGNEIAAISAAYEGDVG